MIIILSNRLVSFLRFLQPKLVILLFFIICYSCQSENENETQIDAIPVEISLDRFDLKFYNQPASVIPNLKSQYPFLFPKQFSDSIWISRQTDSLQLLLQNEVNKTFESTDLIESELSHLFKHIKFYFPSTVVPKVITLTNNVDYQIKTVYLDWTLFWDQIILCTMVFQITYERSWIQNILKFKLQTNSHHL
jgi:hypothetical protein